MTAVTLLELAKEDLPVDCISGTARRRVRYHVRFFNPTKGYTLDLSTYDASLTGIDGMSFMSYDFANRFGTAITWSGTTITSDAVGTAFVCITGYK